MMCLFSFWALFALFYIQVGNKNGGWLSKAFSLFAQYKNILKGKKKQNDKSKK